MGKLCSFSEVHMEKHGKSNTQNGWYGDCIEKVWKVILFMEILW